MSTPVIITFLIVFIPIFISRFLQEKALKNLDAEMKVKLLDAFSNQRKYSGIIMLPLLVAYFLLLQLLPQYNLITIAVFGIGFLVYFVLSRLLNYRKMAALGAPEEYLKIQRLSVWLVGTGFVLVGVQICFILNS